MNVPLTILDFLERTETICRDDVAVVDEPSLAGGSLGTVTYGRLAERARAMAAGLDALGVPFGGRVGVVAKNSARLLEVFFAVSGYGRILVPINFRLGPAEVAYIVEHSGAEVVLVDPDLQFLLDGLAAKHRMVLGEESDRRLLCCGCEPRVWQPDEDATATINYTSGTTARPKGVELTHRNLWINAMLLGLHLGVSRNDVYLHTLPMFHVNGWGMPYILTGVGGRHIMIQQIDGGEILRRVDEHGVTLICGAPTVAARIVEAAAAWGGPVPGKGRVRMVVAGAPPPPHLIGQMEDRLGWEFIQIYGLTETSPLLTVNRCQPQDGSAVGDQRVRRLRRAGAPALGVKLRIDGHGEVLARGSVVLKGYWNQPEASAEALRDGWFHTGDGGEIDDEGYLHITDRKKDIIISGGENIASIEVESVLAGHPAVAEVAVIGVPHEEWGETVKALVVLSPGNDATEDEMIEYCRARLAHFKCPTSVEFRTELSRTATGKLQKFRLRAPYWPAPSQGLSGNPKTRPASPET